MNSMHYVQTEVKSCSRRAGNAASSGPQPRPIQPKTTAAAAARNQLAVGHLTTGRKAEFTAGDILYDDPENVEGDMNSDYFSEPALSSATCNAVERVNSS
jgi:hypothetical protein